MTDRLAAELALAAEFPPATREDWEKLALGVLKGRPLESLTSRTRGGIAIAPLYERAAGARPVAARAPGAPWQILQRVDNPDPKAANAQALEDLENGAGGLTLVFAGAVGADGFGLAPSADAVRQALAGVHLAAIALELDASSLPLDAVEAIAASLGEHTAADATKVRFGLDPLGEAARTGDFPDPQETFARLGDVARGLRARGFKDPVATADARIVHAAGGDEAQELAFALASALAYLRAFESAGIDLAEARRLIAFKLAADADQFLTIGKFRALRKLWARVEESCGLAPEPAFVSAETAWRMMTRRDPHVNLLRTTIATFAAAVGGADAITVLPYTAALGLPDPAARRLARNTQSILLEESSLAKVADPGAGSGALEDLTGKLCAAAWDLFQNIEHAGGLMAALASRMLQRAVAEVRTAREKAVASRRDALTGLSEFPNLAEAVPAVLAPPRRPRRGKDGGAALPMLRLAEPFEALRDASDTILAKTGARPRVFLATLGTPADHLARATFARSLFEAGGIEAVEPASGHSPSALLQDFRRSGAAFVCLCGTDAAYAQDGEEAVAAFEKLGAKAVYVATRPSDDLVALRTKGATFIHAGCDAIATLAAAHAKLGAKAGRS